MNVYSLLCSALIRRGCAGNGGKNTRDLSARPFVRSCKSRLVGLSHVRGQRSHKIFFLLNSFFWGLNFNLDALSYMAREYCTNCVFTRPPRGGDESPLVPHAAANAPLFSVLVPSQILQRHPDEGRTLLAFAVYCLGAYPLYMGRAREFARGKWDGKSAKPTEFESSAINHVKSS